MSARAALNVVYAAAVEHLDAEKRQELDDALSADHGYQDRETRLNRVLALADGEIEVF